MTDSPFRRAALLRRGAPTGGGGGVDARTDSAHRPSPSTFVHSDQDSNHATPLYVFFSLFGCLDGGQGLLMQPSTLESSKMEISKTNFFPYSDHSQ